MDIKQGLGFITGKTSKHPFPQHILDSREIASEGIVLLKNKNNVLPLRNNSVALFGAGAIDTSFCGTGSGFVSTPYTVNIKTGLENNGIRITSNSWLNRYDAINKKVNKEDKTISKIDRVWSGRTILTDDIEITGEDIASSITDTAIYVIRRNAGEGGDRRAVKSDYYLSDIELTNIKKIASAFKNTVIVLNSCVIDANFINDIPGISAAVLLGQAGMEAGNALAQVLTGIVPPSGHLTDTWALKYEDNPASATFGSNDGDNLQEYYTEDIYVGYRYFDTFGLDVLYPFGYGLTYSKCQYSCTSIDATWDKITLTIKVKNIGDFEARFVMQAYVTAPVGNLNKPYQELKGYAKTRILEPGDEEVVTISFATESLASYDTKRAAFVMESGSYLIRVGENSRDTSIAALLSLDDTAMLRQLSNQLSPDREMELLTTPASCIERINKETSEALALVESNQIPSTKLAASLSKTIDGAAKPVAKRISGSGNPKSTFIDVAEGLVSVEDFVDSLDEDVLIRLIAGNANETPHSVKKRTNKKYKPIGGPTSSGSTTSLYVDSLGIPNWKVTDGPAGCHLPFLGVTGWPCGMVQAQTWNDKMPLLAGNGIGKELAYYSQSIILGPGLNIHRDPLCGRAFEYFSEDPYISGKMAAATTIGVQRTPGAGVSIKHFAANNQEEDRTLENNTISERALREIYLRGFEICVKEAQPKTVMTSYNCINGTHTSSSYELITNILRGEWGFKGLVMTDWGSQSKKYLDIAAGNDLIMGGYRPEFFKAYLHGTPAQFDEDGYVHTQEFKVYGGFFKNVVEFWNTFEPCTDGPDEAITTVVAGKELNPKVQDKVKEGIATITVNSDGSKTIHYKGIAHGQMLDIEDVKACASRVLLQIADSVSYKKMKK